MKKIIALATLAAVSATASAASTNLLVDGSFEDVKVSSGNWLIASQQTLKAAEGSSGWIVTSADKKSKLPVGLEIRDNAVGTAQDGVNFIELDGNQNDRISQSFATTIGQEYQITFYYADRAGVSASSLGFDALVFSGIDSITTLSEGASGTTDWTKAVIDFTAGATTTTFSIAAAGTSDSYGTSFDNFSAVAVVPEPTNLGLMAAGLAAIGFAARRRRQA